MRRSICPRELHLVVGSYNIHGGVGSDGVRDLARIARVVNALGADIVALAGGGRVSAARMTPRRRRIRRRRRPTPPPSWPGHTQMLAIRGFTMRRRGADYGNLVLTRFPPLSVRKLDLSVGRQEPRGRAGHHLRHLGRPRAADRHPPGAGAGRAARPGEAHRRAGAHRRRRRRGRHAAAGGHQRVVGVRPAAALAAPLLRGPGARRSHVSRPAGRCSRWIGSGCTPSGRWSRYQVFRGPETRVASDHLPVRAELVLALAAAARRLTGPSGGQGLQQGDGQLREHMAGG